MSGVLMDVFPELLTWTISLYPGKPDSLEPAMMMHSVATETTHHILCFVLVLINGWSSIVPSEIIPFSKLSQFRSFVACANAFANICTIFGNLLMVDRRYSSLAIILVILLVFIVALFVIVSPNPKGHWERGADSDAKKAGDDSIISGREGSSGVPIHYFTGAPLCYLERDGRARGEVGEEEENKTGDNKRKKKELRGEEEEESEETVSIMKTPERRIEARLLYSWAEGPWSASPKPRTPTFSIMPGKKKLIRGEEKESGPLVRLVQAEKEGIETKDDTGNKKEVMRLGGGGGGDEKRRELLWMVRLLCMLLCFMKYVNNNDMEMTNCLLFLSCSLGELTLLMARLPSELDVAPAFQVLHRAFLVMGLLTAHTMAAELLGEFVLLLCMPELVAALAWLTIFLGSSNPASAVRAVETAVRKAVLPLLSLFVGILASIIVFITRVAGDTDEAEWATDLLLGDMSSAIVAVLSSVILPSLCMLVLCQWNRQSSRGQTTAAPSSELDGAIRLLSLCRDGPWKALIIVFLAKQMHAVSK